MFSIVSYLISGFCFIFGSFEPLWNMLKLDNDLRTSFTLGLSLLFLIIGYQISARNREKRFISEISDLKKTFLTLPEVKSLSILSNGAEGVLYVSARLKDATNIKNTRIPIDGDEAIDVDFSEVYIKDTKDMLKKNGVVFKDIIVEQNKVVCDEFKDVATKNGSSYDYKVTNNRVNGFINFIIITDSSGNKEVVFGWPTSAVHGHSSKCFVSHEENLISLFETIFTDLWTSS